MFRAQQKRAVECRAPPGIHRPSRTDAEQSRSPAIAGLRTALARMLLRRVTALGFRESYRNTKKSCVTAATSYVTVRLIGIRQRIAPPDMNLTTRCLSLAVVCGEFSREKHAAERTENSLAGNKLHHILSEIFAWSRELVRDS